MTPGVGPFLVQGDDLNKLGGGPLGDASNQISVVSDKKIFSMCFPI